MYKVLPMLLGCILILAPGTALGQTPDGETPALEDICADESGAAFGLCNAFCEAMDCHLDQPQASATACTKVGDKFEQITGRRPPCENTCPCFSAEDLQQGTVLECGENFPGFPDLAGVIYTDGRVGCSGIFCASVFPTIPSCAHNRISGEFVFMEFITPREDADCRALILQNCPNPNAIPATPSTPSTIPFIDQ